MIGPFDLVGTIHGRECSEHGEYVTADDYYYLQLAIFDSLTKQWIIRK